jgi:hypothetical protein
MRTTTQVPRVHRGHETRRCLRRSRWLALETTTPRRHRSPARSRRGVAYASPCVATEFFRRAAAALRRPPGPTCERWRSHSAAGPRTKQRWSDRANAWPNRAGGGETATPFKSCCTATSALCPTTQKRAPEGALSISVNSSRLRYSSTRRTPSCSWCYEACRAKSRSRPWCPSD